jgi:hypothetical protein
MAEKKRKALGERGQRTKALVLPPAVTHRFASAYVRDMDGWVAANAEPAIAEAYFRLAPQVRVKRAEAFLLAEFKKTRDDLEDRERALRIRGADLALTGLALVDGEIDLVVHEIVWVLETNKGKSQEAMLAALEFVAEAKKVLRNLEDARVKALQGAKALDVAHTRWKHGMFGACSRRLAEVWPANAEVPPRDVEKLSEILGKPAIELQEWLDKNAGARKADGPKVTADRAIAEMVGVSDRQVRTWRSLPGARLFDRLVLLTPLKRDMELDLAGPREQP